MSDVIKVRCVLAKGTFEGPGGECDGRAFINPEQKGNPWHWIACHQAGNPGLTKDTVPQWTYQIKGDRLHFTPSLLDRSDNFHTAYNWDVAFAVLPEGRDPYAFFREINPGVVPESK